MTSEANKKILQNHTLGALIAGATPIPTFDLIAVAWLQLNMVKQLAESHEVSYSYDEVQPWLLKLSPSILLQLAATGLKFIPVFGTILGGIWLSYMARKSTFAFGQVVVEHLGDQGSLSDLDLDDAKRRFDILYAAGKPVARSGWRRHRPED